MRTGKVSPALLGPARDHLHAASITEISVPKGGARAGAGRPKNSVSQRHVEMLAQAAEAGQSPVEYMLAIMRDEDADQKRRDWAAEKVAPYFHPRPAPIARTIEIDLPDTSTMEGVTQALAVVTQAVATGEMAPAEGQSLIAIIEAQRKAIDIRELMERLERLEQSPSGARPGWQASAA